MKIKDMIEMQKKKEDLSMLVSQPDLFFTRNNELYEFFCNTAHNKAIDELGEKEVKLTLDEKKISIILMKYLGIKGYVSRPDRSIGQVIQNKSTLKELSKALKQRAGEIIIKGE